MRTSSIETLTSAWARIAEEAALPADYEGTATPAAHQASEAIQERIREHIVATNDMRLFGLLHLLDQASLRVEQVLWPEDDERMAREVKEALREANDPNAKCQRRSIAPTARTSGDFHEEGLGRRPTRFNSHVLCVSLLCQGRSTCISTSWGAYLRTKLQGHGSGYLYSERLQEQQGCCH